MNLFTATKKKSDIFNRILCVFISILFSVLCFSGCNITKGSKKRVKTVATISNDKAFSVASDLIKRYETYLNIGIACDIDDDYDYSEDEYDAIWSLLTEKQQMYLASIEKCTCCKTYEEAKQHTLRCIDSSLLTNITEDYVIYDGDLYFFFGNHGSESLRNVRLIENNKENIIAYADSYGSADNYCGTYHFEIKNKKTGYYIKDAKKISIEDQKLPILTENKNEKPWMALYRPLLLGFYETSYAKDYNDSTVPVLFDITDDGIPELFIFCAIGARQFTKNGYMFFIENGRIKNYYVENFGQGSGSFQFLKLYEDKTGKRFALMATLIDSYDGLETYGTVITKLSFDGKALSVSTIGSNKGTHHIGINEKDSFSLNGQQYDTFDAYYKAIHSYYSSLTEIDIKSTVKNGDRTKDYPVGMYGIEESDVVELFDEYMNS